ncbi:ABC transporter ATP-binding protein [Cereibacter sp. SYSU M97828]|nr:ABC transporter ATP-binding protein [Cereibacter flavus]
MIHLDDATFAIQGRTILHGISARLDERRIAIIGRNGSGKTTLLRLMAGLIAPTSGRVTVDGTAPSNRRAMLSRIGILFQNPDHQILFPTVAEELSFGLRQMGRDTAAVASLLAAEGRSHWADAPTQSLSQGQKQYLCLMSILLMQPETILLDEPFAGLDLPTQARLARRLAALPQRLVTITHDPAATNGCERVLWIDEGRLRMDGAPDTVLPAFTAEMARLSEGSDAMLC